ncbi:MAG: tetratricopeptide repeat protein [Ignavibacteriales bacterium]|nr:tetratricopeptide repeat protein [Ignavibacteriales bacterium]
MNEMVTFRNKTKGHGSITKEHSILFNPLLQTALESFIIYMKWMKEFPLTFITETKITPENKVIQSISKLMGPEELKIGHFQTDINNYKHTECLYIANENNVPLFPLSPFLLYQDNQFYFLNDVNVKSSSTATYLSYLTGDLKETNNYKETLKIYFDIDELLLRKKKNSDNEVLFIKMFKEAVRDMDLGEGKKKMLDIYKETVGITDERQKELIEISYKELIEETKTEIQILEEQRAEMLIDFGHSYLTYNKYQKAIESFSEALEIKPNNINALLGLGLSYMDIDQIEKAVEHFLKVISIDPKYVIAYNLLSSIFIKTGNFDNAIPCCEKVIEIDPEDILSYMYLSIIYELQLKEDKAIECLEKIISIKSDFTFAYVYLALLIMKNKPDKAIEYLFKVLEINPDDKFAIFYLGMCYENKGIFEKAIEYYLMAINKNPNDSQTLTSLGSLYYRLSKYEQAIECFQQAIYLNDKTIFLYFKLGLSFLCNGDFEQGINQYKKGIELRKYYREERKSVTDVGILELLLQKVSYGSMKEAKSDIQNALIKQPDLFGYSEIMKLLEEEKD